MNKRKRWSKIWTLYSDDEFRILIEQCKSYREVLSHFDFKTSKGGCTYTLKERIKELNISTEHFVGLSNHLKLLALQRKIPLSEILVENSTYNTSHLKHRLIKEGLLKEACSLCDIKTVWKGKRLVLIIDHINGINNDHRLKNLRLVCPNCNSQLPTHCGKHFYKKERERKERERKQRERKHNEEKKCFDCDNIISRNAIRCKSCSAKRVNKELGRHKVKDRPSREILLTDVDELGYSATGRKYGVSDNTIRKWLR